MNTKLANRPHSEGGDQWFLVSLAACLNEKLLGIGGPMLFFFTADLEEGIENTLTKLAGDTTQSGQMNTSEGKAILQKHLDRLEE